MSLSLLFDLNDIRAVVAGLVPATPRIKTSGKKIGVAGTSGATTALRGGSM
jgi:hypothetical protein